MAFNHDNGHNSKLQVLIRPKIGLGRDVRHSIVEVLNHTLANEAVLTLKTRASRWNVSGAGFIELHILFDSQFKQLNDIIDEIAGRMRMLGGINIGSFLEFIYTPSWKNSPGSFQTFCAF